MSDKLRSHSKTTHPINSTNESSLSYNKPVQISYNTNTSSIKLTNTKRKRTSDCQPPTLSKIITVNCKEKTKRTKGYTLIITYYKLTLILGPYKNFDFVNNMNKTIQEELSKIKCTKFNYRPIIQKCFDEITKVMYKEFPVLNIDDKYN